MREGNYTASFIFCLCEVWAKVYATGASYFIIFVSEPVHPFLWTTMQTMHKDAVPVRINSKESGNGGDKILGCIKGM